MFSAFFGLSEQNFVSFFLAFLRIIALVSIAPVMGGQAVPVQVKILLSLILTILLLPVVKTQSILETSSYLVLAMASIREIIFGLFIGFCTKMIFEAFQFAGRLAGNQMGLGVAELIDPQSGAQSSIIGNFLSLIALMLFLQLNGHLFIIKVLYDSFYLAPLNTNHSLDSAKVGGMLYLFSQIFVIGIKLAVPAIVAFSVIEISMGIIARITPQMNIFFIGMPIRLAVGLVVLMIALPIIYILFIEVVAGWKNDIRGLVANL